MSSRNKSRVYKIGDVAELLGLTADTLRYYEKCGVLPKIARTASGIRQYEEADISRLRFIQRAQKMNFSLAEIRDLLSLREDPQHVRDDVRQLTEQKLQETQAHLAELSTLCNELQLLLDRCRCSKGGCPIIERIDNDEL